MEAGLENYMSTLLSHQQADSQPKQEQSSSEMGLLRDLLGKV